MKKTKDFLFGCDRYVFDFGECSVKNGFAQIDTKQDFHGHGAWANPFTLRIVSYTEGDLYNTIASKYGAMVDGEVVMIKYNGNELVAEEILLIGEEEALVMLDNKLN